MENKFNLPESAVKFLDYLHTNNKSPNTIVGYESDLHVFYEFLKEYKKAKKITNKIIQSLILDDLNNFLSYTKTKQKKNSECARARKVSTLKSYFSYMYENNIIKEDIAKGLKKITIGKKIPIAFNDEQVEKIFSSLTEVKLN